MIVDNSELVEVTFRFFKNLESD